MRPVRKEAAEASNRGLLARSRNRSVPRIVKHLHQCSYSPGATPGRHSSTCWRADLRKSYHLPCEHTADSTCSGTALCALWKRGKGQRCRVRRSRFFLKHLTATFAIESTDRLIELRLSGVRKMVTVGACTSTLHCSPGSNPLEECSCPP